MRAVEYYTAIEKAEEVFYVLTRRDFKDRTLRKQKDAK